MDILFTVLSALCLLGGMIGCIVPMLPGPPLAYIGLLFLQITDAVQFSTGQLLVWLVAVTAAQLLDYVMPMLGSRYSGGSKWGEWGCVAGTFVGLFFMPWGLLVGPFLGAVVGELLHKDDLNRALKSGLGSLLGFLFGTVLKVAICGYFMWQFLSVWW